MYVLLRDTLRQLIVHRIGKDKFDECLNYVGASENFIKAAKSPRVSYSSVITQIHIQYIYIIIHTVQFIDRLNIGKFNALLKFYLSIFSNN